MIFSRESAIQSALVCHTTPLRPFLLANRTCLTNWGPYFSRIVSISFSETAWEHRGRYHVVNVTRNLFTRARRPLRFAANRAPRVTHFNIDYLALECDVVELDRAALKIGLKAVAPASRP
jgi:hypothetical protein